MTCPTADKWSQYVDELLSEKEHIDLQRHLNACYQCQQVVDIFQKENEWIKQTLQSPTLPEDFASSIVDQLEPYPQRKQKKYSWKQVTVAAASVMIAIGLSTSFSPAFAQWIGGLFASDRVDEGLQIATEAGFAQRVNKEVTDNGLTFKVEDIVADSSRVAVSYQVLNEKGKAKNPYFDLGEGKNEVFLTNSQHHPLEVNGMGWFSTEDYGMIELSLREIEPNEEIIVTFELSELNGKQGQWSLDIPVDLQESLKATTTTSLDEAITTEHGVTVQLKKMTSAPSSKELFYETKFTDDEQSKVKAAIANLEETYGKEIAHSFTNFGTAIQYHIENEANEAIYHHNTFFDGKGHPSDSGLLHGSGESLGDLGHYAWNESFIPQKNTENLTFVLDGVIKTEPSDFEVTIHPKLLKKQPVSFEYEGNYVTIKEAKMVNHYSLRKSLLPIKKESIFTIEMEGSKESPASGMGTWVLIDEKGKSYFTYQSGSTLDEKDEHGRYLTSDTILSYEMDEVPEQLTLRLLSVTRYYELNESWSVPLY